MFLVWFGFDPNWPRNKLSRVSCGGYVLLVAEAICYWLRRLCVTGCGGYVFLVVEAMWCWLRRLCGAGCGGYVVLVAESMCWIN